MLSNKEHLDKVKKFKEKLDSVSPTFCLAKWLQVTTNLYNGTTHSCHHPTSHKIDENDLLNNPNSLHNTPIKIFARKEMLEGIQTKECQYCWNIENLPEKTISDRIYKSSSSWAAPYFYKVLDSKLGENINPTYMEIAFENICNFKCTYCMPDISSRWMEEIQHHGPYKLSEYELHNLDYLKRIGRFPIHHKEYNPYIEAFWKWWPTLYNDLHTFRITGGEPLLSENTWKILDYIKDNPRKELTFAINSNMGIPHDLVLKLISYSNDIIKNNKVKAFMLFTSAESIEKQCEYIRYGMDWTLFCKNIETYLEMTDKRARINFMVTANLLGSPSFKKFLEFILKLRQKHNITNAYNRVSINIPYLRHPPFISVTQLPNELKKKYTEEWKDFVRSNSDNKKIGMFYLEEIDQIDRLCAYMNSKEPEKTLMKDFYLYYTEADKRRKTNFVETFPELENYFYECRDITL
jgi:organic radical activating enzyme